ncbi:MAG: HlyD family efflux transporter periplasmic adaptor subunit, partial [Bacteroidota bacterium]
TLLSKIDGRIDSISITSGQLVSKGQILAVLQSSGNPKDIFYLDSILNSEITLLTTSNLYEIYPTTLDLGPEIQEAYQNFIQSYLGVLLLKELNIGEQNISSLEQQESKLESRINSKRRQLRNAVEKLNTGKQELDRYQKLFDKGVFSESELNLKKQEYLDLVNSKNQFQEELESLRGGLLETTNLKDNTMSGLEKDNLREYSDLQLNRQGLVADITSWKEKYVFQSPINGKVSTYDTWSKDQEVSTGENVLSIIPNDPETILAKLKVRVNNTGELKIGQPVIIDLDNYPSEEWGTLSGKIKYVSDIPKREETPYYVVDVELNNLTTDYNKNIEFKQNMSGTGRIILKKLSLAERAFYGFRKLFDQN